MTDQNDPLAIAKQALRDHREAALSATDWAVLPDSPLTDAAKAEFAAYRQFLRDLPGNSSDQEVMTFSGIPTLDAWRAAQAPV